MTATAQISPMDIATLKSLYKQNLAEAKTYEDEISLKRIAVDEQIAAIEKQFADDNFNIILGKNEAIEAAQDYEAQLRLAAVHHFDATGMGWEADAKIFDF